MRNRILSIFLCFLFIFSRFSFVKANSIALTPSPQIAGMYQGLPPQAKFAVGVVLVGCGVVVGAVQGKNVVDEYYNAHKDEINKQIAVTKDGIITVSNDFVSGVKGYAQSIKDSVNPNSSFTTGDVCNYKFGDNDIVQISILGTINGEKFYQECGTWNVHGSIVSSVISFSRGVSVSVKLGNGQDVGCCVTSNTKDVVTQSLSLSVRPGSFSLDSLKGVDGICAYPSKSIPNYDGTQDLVITPGAGAISADGYNIPSSTSRTNFPTSVADVNVGKLNPDGTVSTGANDWTGEHTGTGEGTNTGAIDYTPSLSGIKDILTDTKAHTKSISDTVSHFFDLPTKSIDFTPLKTVGIENKFPFCIPFDLSKSIKALNVSPQAPKWTINFDSKYFTGGGSIAIDFVSFEKWAIVIRWGILIFFTISLIVLTRRIIGGN